MQQVLVVDGAELESPLKELGYAGEQGPATTAALAATPRRPLGVALTVSHGSRAHCGRPNLRTAATYRIVAHVQDWMQRVSSHALIQAAGTHAKLGSR